MNTEHKDQFYCGECGWLPWSEYDAHRSKHGLGASNFTFCGDDDCDHLSCTSTKLKLGIIKRVGFRIVDR